MISGLVRVFADLLLLFIIHNYQTIVLSYNLPLNKIMFYYSTQNVMHLIKTMTGGKITKLYYIILMLLLK